MKVFITIPRTVYFYSILFITIALYSLPVNAQSDNGFFCATEQEDIISLSPEVYSRSVDPLVLSSFEPVVLNIFYWQINDPNGNNNNPLTERNVLESVAFLNKEFNDINVFFKYRGFGEINSPNDVVLERFINASCVTLPALDAEGFGSLNRCQISEFSQFINSNSDDYHIDNAMNVYVPYETESFGGVFFGANRIAMQTASLEIGIMSHEMGHALGLSHTWGGYDTDNCEHVTRDPNDPNFNADIRGDGIVDTAAVPDFLREFCYTNDLPNSVCIANENGERFFYLDTQTCTYNGDVSVDCQGTLYQIFPEDVQNIMANAPSSCFNVFSPGQGIHIQETITNSTILAAIQTDIAALYEPYKGEYYFAGPLNPEINPPYLQPGFNYIFYPCSGNFVEPAAFEDTSFDFESFSQYTISAHETDFERIRHPNHTAFTISHPALDGIPRRCHNNNNRAPRGGRIIRFVDDTFNQNITVIDQDSLQINNTLLIPNLDAGLYKIEKDFMNGEVQDTIIMKTNN